MYRKTSEFFLVPYFFFALVKEASGEGKSEFLFVFKLILELKKYNSADIFFSSTYDCRTKKLCLFFTGVNNTK